MKWNPASALGLAVLLLLMGCGQRDASRQSESSADTSQGTNPAPATTSTPAESMQASVPSSTVGEAPPENPAPAAESPPPTPEPAPSGMEPSPEETPPATNSQPGTASPPPAEPPKSAEPPPAPRVVDPGGMVEVQATKAGLTRVGPEKCKMCHKVQFESWSATAHAKRTPPLDCESCHGAGSEYKALSVMKDLQKAKAAGLVLPTREFCATCHRSGWSDDMLAHAHAHKPAAGAH